MFTFTLLVSLLLILIITLNLYPEGDKGDVHLAMRSPKLFLEILKGADI